MRAIQRSPQDRTELARRREKRLAKAIAEHGCCNMNDTKWGKFFDIVLAVPQSMIRIRTKMLYNKKPTVETWLRRVTPRYTDSLEGPFKNREIEWIEVVGDSTADLLEELREVGQLPIVEIENGFRIIAYGPIEIT